jgi:hypothetical protein
MNKKIEEYITEYLNINETYGSCFLKKGDLLATAKEALEPKEFENFCSSPEIKLKKRQVYYYISAKDFAKRVQKFSVEFEKKINSELWQRANEDGEADPSFEMSAPGVRNISYLLMHNLNIKSVSILDTIKDDNVLKDFLVELYFSTTSNKGLKNAISRIENSEGMTAKEALRLAKIWYPPKETPDKNKSPETLIKELVALRKENELLKKNIRATSLELEQLNQSWEQSRQRILQPLLECQQ